MKTLLDVINEAEPNGNQHGGEWNAPRCPWCGTGDDRLVIWPDHSRHETGMVWCRRCENSCDGIHFVREFRDMSWHEACEFFGIDPEVEGDGSTVAEAPSVAFSSQRASGSESDKNHSHWTSYDPPSDKWREAARTFAADSRERLWSDTKVAEAGRQYLDERGLEAETIKRAGLGLNPNGQWPRRTDWGLDLPDDPNSSGKMWLPKGIVIPWADKDGLSGINIRRFPEDVQPDSKDEWKRRKYQRAPGPSAPLYGAKQVQKGKPAVIVEGEFDALAIRQKAADLVVPVATGSTGGARRQYWLNLLSRASSVLVAFDAEEPGKKAARVWLNALPNATRWSPHLGDTAEMLQQREDLRMWVRCGIQAAAITE